MPNAARALLSSLRPRATSLWPLALVAIAAVAFFVNLGGAHLWDVDEAIFSQTAREMLDRGDAVVPYFNGQLFAHKPPLVYWLMMAAYWLLGTTEFAARLPSALFGVASVLLTYRLGKLTFSPRVGFWAALILAGNVSFALIARAATPDALLTFFCTLAVYAFVATTAKARIRSGEPNERNAPWAGQTRFEPSWFGWALIYAAMGLAVLTKGPIGVVLPTAVIGLFLLVMRAEPKKLAGPATASAATSWRLALRNVGGWLARVLSPLHVLRTIWSMRPLTALAVVLAVAGPWFAAVGWRTDGVFLSEFFGVHNFGRFLGPMENHRGPFFYYVVAMAIGFFPWSVLAAPSLIHVRQQWSAAHPWRAGYVLIGAWLAVWVGFFSLAGTKLPSYVVPAYPALALFTGAFVDGWLRDAAAVSRLWTRMIWGTVALVGVAMLVALPIIARRYLHDDWLLAAVAIIPLSAAVIGLVAAERGRIGQSLATLATLGIVFVAALFGFGSARVDRYQDTPWLAATIATATPPGEQPAIGSFRCFRPSYVFYTGAAIGEFESAAEVEAFFAAHPDAAFVITTDEAYQKIAGELPREITVLDSHPRFLRPARHCSWAAPGPRRKRPPSPPPKRRACTRRCGVPRPRAVGNPVFERLMPNVARS